MFRLLPAGEASYNIVSALVAQYKTPGDRLYVKVARGKGCTKVLLLTRPDGSRVLARTILNAANSETTPFKRNRFLADFTVQ